MTCDNSIAARRARSQDDERAEATPKSIRLRKALLDPNERKRAERAKGGVGGQGGGVNGPS